MGPYRGCAAILFQLMFFVFFRQVNFVVFCWYFVAVRAAVLLGAEHDGGDGGSLRVPSDPGPAARPAHQLPGRQPDHRPPPRHLQPWLRWRAAAGATIVSIDVCS